MPRTEVVEVVTLGRMVITPEVVEDEIPAPDDDAMAEENGVDPPVNKSMIKIMKIEKEKQVECDNE